MKKAQKVGGKEKIQAPQDALVDCPRCKESFAAYKTPVNETKFAYWCWACGFATSDLMKAEDFNQEEYEGILPELFKDIKSVDEEGRVWYPITVDLPEKGTVFPYGKDPENWQWAAIRTTALTEEEKKQPRFEGKAYKSDPSSLKMFGTDFIEALDYIGFFNA